MAHFRHSSFGDPPTTQEIERQVRWEVDANNRAVKEYHRYLSEGHIGADGKWKPPPAASDVGAGQRVIREAMIELVPQLSAMQEAIRDQLAGSKGQPREWWTYFCLLPADTLAYLALRSVFGEAPCQGIAGGRKLSQCSRTLVQMVQGEVGYLDFAEAEADATREAKKLGVAYTNQFRALQRRVKGSITRRQFSRWMSRLHRAWLQPWPEAERRQFGDAVIRQVVDHGSALFEMQTVPLKGGKTEYYIRPTQRALAVMQDHHARAEVAHPIDRPMLCRPKPWKWIEENVTCTTTAATTSIPETSFALA